MKKDLPEIKNSEDYSEAKFWHKVKKYAKIAGSEVIEKALILYYIAQDSTTPAWAKGVIYGALGYFILPADAIPDIVPIVGFSDDLGAIAACFFMVSIYATKEIKKKAADQCKKWLG